LPVKKPSILAQTPARPSAHPWQYAALAALSLFTVAAFGTAPDTVLDTVQTRIVERVLPLPAIKDDEAATTYWREERVQRGDTLGSLLARAGVNDAEAMQYLRTTRPRALFISFARAGRCRSRWTTTATSWPSASLPTPASAS